MINPELLGHMEGVQDTYESVIEEGFGMARMEGMPIGKSKYFALGYGRGAFLEKTKIAITLLKRGILVEEEISTVTGLPLEVINGLEY